MNKCPCGSGLERFEVYNGDGIFVEYMCDACYYDEVIYENSEEEGDE